MRKMITLGIILTLALGLTGCDWFAAEQQEGGGGVAADESADNYPPAPEIEDPLDEEPIDIREGLEKVAPLLYSAEGANAVVTEKESTFDYTAEQLKSMAAECGTEHEEGYFAELVKTYANTPKYTYEFKYDGESQDPDTYTATVLLNRMEYADIVNVKADFDQCFAGGDMYPMAVTPTLILFAGGCGTGFSEGPELPIGCADIKKVVETTFELNPEYRSL